MFESEKDTLEQLFLYRLITLKEILLLMNVGFIKGYKSRGGFSSE